MKILHVASFNGNIGDNAHHTGFRNALRTIIGTEIEYTELEMRYFYKSIHKMQFDSPEFINMCNSHDLVVIGGGNFFELKWDYSQTGTTVDISTNTLEKIHTPIFFNALGCDASKGASTSAIEKFEHFLDYLTQHERYFITMRNDGSKKTMKSLFKQKYQEKVHFVPDGGFLVDYKLNTLPNIPKNSIILGLNIVKDMKDFRFDTVKGHIPYDDFIDQLGSLLNILLEQNSRIHIILFPHIYSDIEAINDLLLKIDEMKRRTKLSIAPLLTGKGSDPYIFGLYRSCQLILGMRFHTNVCSIAQNIPTIALASYEKINFLYEELDLLHRCLNVNKPGFAKKLHSMITSSLQNLPDLNHFYQELNANIKSAHSKFYSSTVKTWLMRRGLIGD